MRKLAVATLFVVLILVSGQATFAYVLTNHRWANGKEPFDVFVDTGSFANLVGDSLNSTESMYWIGWALSEWKVRSGADFDYSLFTTTNAHCETTGDGQCVWGDYPARHVRMQ